MYSRVTSECTRRDSQFSVVWLQVLTPVLLITSQILSTIACVPYMPIHKTFAVQTTVFHTHVLPLTVVFLNWWSAA
jgi:hypothetical protein